MTTTIFEIFAARADAAPSAPFLIAPDGAATSYGAALQRVRQLAWAIVGAGVGPGDRVVIHADKSAEALLVYLAVQCAGAVLLPLNPAYTPSELEHFLTDAEPRLLIHRTEDEEPMAALASKCAGLARRTLDSQGKGSLAAAADQADPSFASQPANADDLTAILYTSGTTGRSKGAMLTHRNLVSNAVTLASLWRFTATDILLHALPIFHTHGLFVATNITIVAGGVMLLLPRFDADAVVRLLPWATAMMGVPTFYSRLLADPSFTSTATASIRLFVSGSAPLSAETHKAFEARTGHAILERYGMTETNMNTSNPYTGERRAGSVGPPLPDVALRIADPSTGAPLPHGEVGVIEVRGPNVFKGYWRQPERTAAEFRDDGYFITGDMARIDADGYVSIVGRAKDLIISGGFNIYPAEVEAAIDAIGGIAESAVIGVPHPDLGEATVAVLVNGVPQLDEDALLTLLAARLARYKLPRRVVHVDALPRNTMGKVQKNVLRTRFADIFGQGLPG